MPALTLAPLAHDAPHRLKQVKLVDAAFIWCEEHSKRIKTRLKVQKEVEGGVILQETFVVEYIVRKPHRRSTNRAPLAAPPRTNEPCRRAAVPPCRRATVLPCCRAATRLPANQRAADASKEEAGRRRRRHAPRRRCSGVRPTTARLAGPASAAS